MVSVGVSQLGYTVHTLIFVDPGVKSMKPIIMCAAVTTVAACHTSGQVS